MSFGINRDYTRTERRVWKNLARHAELMRQLQEQGMAKDQASAEAFRLMAKPEEGSKANEPR